ncbi:MAG TPA: glycosyltransferase [Ktedonobacteraceae bacterium]
MTIRPRTRTSKRAKKEARGSQRRPPHFSVVLCTYNRRNFVLATLTTLRRQTLPYDDFEVIVVDNGSRDGTFQAVTSYIEADETKYQKPEEAWRAQCILEPKNGLAYARNTGLLAASGAIIVFVDDDTLIDPHMLQNLWEAYQETGADAIGMRVGVHWDMTSPHWMAPELLSSLGYFSPDTQRCQLGSEDNFASCAFSVKKEVLHDINYFSPFLSKRINLPSSVEIADLCLRLRQGGYTLWYEPQALVMHRATSARLRRAYFVGRSYWQGRSEIMLHYRHQRQESAQEVWQEIWHELCHFARCFFLEGPLIRLAKRPTRERLLASMEQSHSWGRLIQRLAYLEHLPSDLDMPSVLLVHGPTTDTSFELLSNTLDKQEVRYLSGQPEIPLRWLWRHRRYRDQPVGILHFYRPGAMDLTRQQRQHLCFRLWLARRWGLRIVVTDTGGWWQSAQGSQFRERRLFERKLLHASHAILSSSKQPSLLYRERRLRKRVRYLLQPGFRGHYPPALARDEARRRLGIATSANFVYLCLAPLHTEREIIFLLEAFYLITQGSRREESRPDVCLLLVGDPVDCAISSRVLRLVARDPQVHARAEQFDENDLPLYMGACNIQILPHLAVHNAGSLVSAHMALSYERMVIAPDLPRFSGILPALASVPYVPGSRESLAEAMVKTQQMTFTLQEEEVEALDVQQSWGAYARQLVKIYRDLLGHA